MAEVYGPALPALTQPSVSIVICSHNYGRFLEHTIRSALQQSYPCEVVVVDDGSSDDSREILAGLRDRIKVVLQPNAGQRAAYNTGFAESDGDVIIFLDADDYLMPDAAGAVAGAFAAGVAKVHYRMHLVDEHDRRLGGVIPSRLARGDQRRALVRWGLLYASAPGSGNAYRRAALAPLMPLPGHPEDRHGADYFAIYGCALFGEVRAIDRPLAAYRVHSERTTAASGLVFGNAASRLDPRVRFESRSAQLRSWIAERSSGRIDLPPRLLDFAQAKAVFAQQIFQHAYWTGLRRGCFELPALLESLWRDSDFTLPRKLGLSAWALAVLCSPRALGFPIARYVSNPASRGGRRAAA
jgi:glycosyltransferase involved in cell wall biosynthesis